MLTIEIILCLAVVGNFGWAYWSWSVHKNRMRFYRMMDTSTQSAKADADQMLRSAIRAAGSSMAGQEFKVCSSCKRIVALHETDESGQTVCANCMLQRTKDLARRI